mgnify:CR=1 FL=1
MPIPDPASVEALIEAALEEDVGRGDLTSIAVLPEDARLAFAVTTRQDIVVAGIDIAAAIFKRLAGDAIIEKKVEDGAAVVTGTVLMTLDGSARGLLSAERTALNILQFLSGIATTTRSYVDVIDGTGAVLLDTRKTVPGLRTLSKYASAVGGARNHRMRLDDGVLIKDNHIAVAGSLSEAVRRAQAAGLEDIEVECDTLDQLEQALNAGARRILLDNMSNDELRQAVERTGDRATLEASGGVTLKTIRAIAKTGVGFISVGRITQSAPAVDIGLDQLT